MSDQVLPLSVPLLELPGTVPNDLDERGSLIRLASQPCGQEGFYSLRSCHS